jgi:hypothetical protein
MTIGVAEAATEIVKANVSEVYKDSLQPAVRIIGNSLAQCASLFVSPVGRVAVIFEKNINKCLDRLDGVAEDNLVEPDPRIAVPVLEKLRYVEDAKVSDYYAEILASASQKDKKNMVMLSYIEILNRVTADELKILEYINSEQNTADVSSAKTEDKIQYNIPENIQYLGLRGSLPVIDVKLMQKVGYHMAVKNFNNLPDKISLDHGQNIAAYIDNLISLGLMIRPFAEHLIQKPIYNELRNNPVISVMSLMPDQKIEIVEGKIDLTSLCYSLLAMCQRDRSPK